MIGQATTQPSPDLIAKCMKEAGADFMFIGKGALVLLGYSGSTLDISPSGSVLTSWPILKIQDYKDEKSQ